MENVDHADDAPLKKRVNNLPTSSKQIDRDALRKAAIRAARGSMAHVGVTVDDLDRERQADKTREECVL